MPGLPDLGEITTSHWRAACLGLEWEADWSPKRSKAVIRRMARAHAKETGHDVLLLADVEQLVYAPEAPNASS